MKQIDPPEHTPSLIDVQLAFAHWRKSRTLRGSTPDRLRALAVQLLNRHRHVAVCEALGVNSTALKQWVKQVGLIADNDDSPVDFISLPLNNEPVHQPEPSHLTINLPNGVQGRAQAAYTLSELLVAAGELGTNP